MKLIALLVLLASSWWPASLPAPIGFIGDSITAQAPGGTSPADVAASILGTTAINRAVSGTRTAQWLPGGRLLPDAFAAFAGEHVRLVHILLGTNDARWPAYATPEIYERNLAAICGAVRAAGMVPVVSLSPYAVPGAYRGTRSAIGPAVDVSLLAYRAGALGLAARGICRLGDTTIYAATLADPSLLRDGIHPGARGVVVFGARWAAALG